ncbi:MAG TPA: hypothetical protein VMI31_17085 [Fimbriimonadaceae bacterium]|nr:hypothetical protein [Fimbriimonadaceae bacterium]
MKVFAVAASALLIGLGTATVRQDSVPFSRTYKEGEKIVYAATQSINFGGEQKISLDIEMMVAKAVDTGGADLAVHMSNLQLSANNSATLPPDFVLHVRANNMPDKFSPTMGNVDFLALLLQLASFTPDKPVKVGDIYPVVWKNGTMGFEGSGTILEISSDKKTIKTSTKVQVDFNGQAAGDFTFTGTFDAGNGSLVESKGEFSLGPQEFTFTRKPTG